jgi:microcystin-dependent protein
MSKRAWLTPDSTTETRQCWRVFVPDIPMMEAAFRGALHLLSSHYNWEQHGSATPEETAQMWIDANFHTFKMEQCNNGENGMEIGTVFWFASETPPSGALVCNGQSVSAAAYPYLFGILGYAYGGSGDDFSLPDLRDMFIRGVSSTVALHSSGGEDTHQLTIPEMPAHQHGLMQTIQPDTQAGSVPGVKSNTYVALQTELAGGDEAHNNIPSYTALVAMIKAS